MCGIVGYVGAGNAKNIILDGLKKLEYRGYDSSGIALCSKGKIEVRKALGRIAELEEILSKEDIYSNTGIGHTRWATHGSPSWENAHPHCNSGCSVALVHNGIIENYVELRDWLINDYGIVFKSETDTEVIAHLVGFYYDGNLQDAVYKTVEKMRGAFSIAVVCEEEPDKIVAYRRDAPLIAGIGRDANFIASDIPALLKYVREIYLIENNEMVVVTKDAIKIYNANREPVNREVFHVTWDADAAEKEGYEHFMLKEIHEQPKGLYETLNRRLDKDGHINLDGIKMTKEDLMKFNKVYIVACGTAYHAGLVGKEAIEKMAKIPVEVEVASEFRYRDPFVDANTLFIGVSQSGETLDTLAALREAKRKGARVLSVVNVVGSSVARESDDVFYTWAGPEIAVASTKAYTTQLMCMYLIALYMGRTKGTIDEGYYNKYICELKEIPEKLKTIFEKESEIQEIAKSIYMKDPVFFIGRGPDVGVSYEGSLKLKEISYINSFAIAAGELKHGTIALIEQGTLVVALATQEKLYEKMLSNIQEVKARGAYVLGLAKVNNQEIERHGDQLMVIPNCMDEISPLLSVVPLQLLAYYIAKERGCDIDKPKNLAKSVTVE
ncbi:MAG: glutamine--fructose-6-phosphate transaminase (isomerizing) [Anaerovoracaceae bacterium]|jgi:glucosamine--fructose-6-phosphate aminotransferase (isomerizing)|nr:glutamine--fructose-6-phosphate transaminase (isomerizing) [Anaerovoracaceae bacterium]